MPKSSLVRWSMILVLLAVLFMPTGIAIADAGPKPSLEFHFVNLATRAIKVVSGHFLACKDMQCLETQALERYPSAGLTCEENSCSGRMYFYSGPMRLSVLFSDNQTRISNPFTVPTMHNIYSVRVRDADLVVARNVYLSNNADWGLFLLFIPFTAVALLMFGGGLLASNISLERRNLGTQPPFQATPGRYIFTWLLAVIALVGGALLTWALPLTILIELVVAYLYVRYLWPVRHRIFIPRDDQGITQEHVSPSPLPLLPLMTAVASVNLLTQPGLWIMASSRTWSIASAVAWPILIMEGVVWLIEALLLRLAQWRHLKWLDAFVLSFLMNLVSYVIGLVVSL